MTRFAGHSDITNFLQRNQFADKVGAAGMSAYADQAIGGFLQDATVTTGGMKADQLAEIGKIRRKAGATMASQDASSMLTNSVISGIGSLAGGAIRGGHFSQRPSMGTPISGVSDNPIPGQVGNSISGARGTILDAPIQYGGYNSIYSGIG